MRHLARTLLLSVLLPVAAGAIAYFITSGSVLASAITTVVAAAVGVLLSLVASSKQLIEPVKLVLESRKLYWEGHEKKRSVEAGERRIVVPKDAEIRKYGAQFTTRDILATYRKETDKPSADPLVAKAQERKIDGTVEEDA